MFDKKGVILTTLKTGSSLDDAETDGIEVLQAHIVLIFYHHMFSKIFIT